MNAGQWASDDTQPRAVATATTLALRGEGVFGEGSSGSFPSVRPQGGKTSAGYPPTPPLLPDVLPHVHSLAPSSFHPIPSHPPCPKTISWRLSLSLSAPQLAGLGKAETRQPHTLSPKRARGLGTIECLPPSSSPHDDSAPRHPQLSPEPPADHASGGGPSSSSVHLSTHLLPFQEQ